MMITTVTVITMTVIITNIKKAPIFNPAPEQASGSVRVQKAW